MLKVGLAGARAQSTLKGFQARSGEVEVAAICDLNEDIAKNAAAKNKIPKKFRIFEDMLEADIDAVVIATPMQCHVPQAMAALEAGKHVLSEVTAGVTMDELWWLVEAVEKSGKVYMMAENYKYIPENQVIAAMVRAGLFGKPYFGEGEYLHSVTDRLRYSDGKKTWRNYWQLGTRGCFYPTHSLGPVMQWFAGDRIEAVSCFSAGQNRAAELGLRQDDTTVTLCRMKSGGLIKLRVDCMSKRPHNLHYYSLQGTKGCYEAPRGLGDKAKIWLDSMPGEDEHNPKWHPLEDYYGEFMPERYQNATEDQKAAGHWGGDFFLIDDFLASVFDGKKPAVDVYDACEWTAVGLLSALSVTNGGREIEMPVFRNNPPLGKQVTRI
ncbi:MAG TPA: Gfo/Idh/MocA family oxidoreductase [Clostridiales bacterium]|nr:MAG: Alpha-N-acetylgalactosaminidase [Firmicutes bacterium ADurb.Bin262]HOU10710.1 Gfo/Idh/MocA family oxidoreductase [Clostridiales bacterium]HQK74259.1 Gfo/Idh/MocA family oxidoreductase [Clostridiales bacterium]